MKDTYTKLMMQQHTSDDAAFYEKLENIGTGRKHKPVWKAAVAVVCILLLIPASVWAAENIFGTANITVYKQKTSIDNLPAVGMDIQYENIENYTLKDFSDHLQKLDDDEEVLHSSLEDAEKYLGLDLIKNDVLSAEDPQQVSAWGETNQKHETYCGVQDGQLLFAQVQSVYTQKDIRFKVTAVATVEHPTADGKEYHRINANYFDQNNRNVHSEQYLTKAGIPAMIVTVKDGMSDGVPMDFFACFAVNNISYKIEPAAWVYSGEDFEKYENPEEKLKVKLTEVLDGFVME